MKKEDIDSWSENSFLIAYLFGYDARATDENIKKAKKLLEADGDKIIEEMTKWEQSWARLGIPG